MFGFDMYFLWHSAPFEFTTVYSKQPSALEQVRPKKAVWGLHFEYVARTLNLSGNYILFRCF